MLKYGKNIIFNPDLLHPLSIDRQSTNVIPDNSKVLEIGCATGFMGKYLTEEKHCQVYGVELAKSEYLVAKKVLREAVLGDIEDEKVIEAVLALGQFDIVFASALIEHLRDPWGALKTWKRFLKKNGLLILTTSNIAHWSMRLKLLKGDFSYQKYGILDNTHLRFFTPTTFKKLVEDSGYKILQFSTDPVGGGFPKASLLLSKLFPSLFAYQMLIVAKKK